MRLARRVVKRLPVANRITQRIDQLRDERDRLRTQRDLLRHELDEARRNLEATDTADPSQLEAAVVNGHKTPSFLARTETLRRVREHSRQMHGHRDPIWEVNRKDAGTRFAQSLGVEVPRLIQPPVALNQLELPDYPRLLVKPVFGAAGRGVTPLVRNAEGLWTNVFDQSRGPRLWPDIKADLYSIVETGRIASEFLIEEFIEGPTPLSVPYDWKLLCVDGRVELIFARDARNQPTIYKSRYRYWSRDWEDLGPIRDPHKVDPTIPGPLHPTELVETAELVAGALPAIFTRVDLFERATGVVFGEITPQPGNALWFGREVDRRIGEAWDVAEARSWAK